MLGHASIVLTADTYTSVLPEVAPKAAALIIKAGCRSRELPAPAVPLNSPGGTSMLFWPVG